MNCLISSRNKEYMPFKTRIPKLSFMQAVSKFSESWVIRDFKWFTIFMNGTTVVEIIMALPITPAVEGRFDGLFAHVIVIVE